MYDPSTFIQDLMQNGGIGSLHGFGQDEFSPLEQIVQNEHAYMQPAPDRITPAAGYDVDAGSQEQLTREHIVHEIDCAIERQKLEDFEPISSSVKEIWDRILTPPPGPLSD